MSASRPARRPIRLAACLAACLAARGLALALLALAALCLPGAGTGVFAREAGLPGHFDAPPGGAGPASGPRVVRFLTSDDYPPFQFLAPDGALAGFNVDLARSLCEAMRAACTVQARRWDTLIDALLEQRGDAIIGAHKFTPALRRRVEASIPYLKTPARFVTRRAAPVAASPSGLAGRKVGVVAASAHHAFLAEFFAAAERRPFTGLGFALAALARGEIDAVFGDGPAIAVWLNGEEGHSCCGFAGGPYLESRFFGEGLVVLVRPGDQPLRRAVDAALRDVARRGVIDELYLRYFPVGFF
jgi:polar amino acid transport system substrate-binding protein